MLDPAEHPLPPARPQPRACTSTAATAQRRRRREKRRPPAPSAGRPARLTGKEPGAGGAPWVRPAPQLCAVGPSCTTPVCCGSILDTSASPGPLYLTVLSSTLPGIRVAAVALLISQLALHGLFHPVTFNLLVSYTQSVSILVTMFQKLTIYSDNLCLWIGAFSLLKLIGILIWLDLVYILLFVSRFYHFK